MVEITKKRLKEFQDIWRKNYGKDISEDEAYEIGSQMVVLMRMLLEGKSRRKEASKLSTYKN